MGDVFSGKEQELKRAGEHWISSRELPMGNASAYEQYSLR